MTRNCYPSSAGAVSWEVVENRVPIVIEEDNLLADTAGRGQWRGAPGQRLKIRKRPNHELPVSIFLHPDRLRYPSPGLAGGEPGAPNLIFHNERNLAPEGALTTGEIVLATPEDVFTALIAGGGGYGPPELRDAAATERDEEFGYVTRPR
jgi:N-methylhydantoinase B/oxoprolinase/acetone carboxylase alpha subunit